MENNNQIYIKASSIEPTDVKWLWYPYIPFGKVTIVQGDPGDGKSTLMLTLAALLTTGNPLPFSEFDEITDPVTVIYQTTEDDAADTVVPRFLRANGNPERLIFIKEDIQPLTFADERIITVLKETGAKMLVLDPLSSYIGGCSINAANEVRPQFNFLVNAAKETGCAIVVIDHMNKMQGCKGVYRTIGSVDIVGAVRSVLTVTRDSDDNEKRYLVMTKSNLAPTGTAIVFSVRDGGIEFLDEIDADADAFINGITEKKMGRPDDRTQEAIEFIKKLLASGPLPSAECEKRIREMGIKASTAKKAKRELGIVSTKQQISWTWSLPEQLRSQ